MAEGIALTRGAFNAYLADSLQNLSEDLVPYVGTLWEKEHQRIKELLLATVLNTGEHVDEQLAEQFAHQAAGDISINASVRAVIFTAATQIVVNLMKLDNEDDDAKTERVLNLTSEFEALIQNKIESFDKTMGSASTN